MSVELFKAVRVQGGEASKGGEWAVGRIERGDVRRKEEKSSWNKIIKKLEK
jgi:hypothetical protein